MCTVSDKLQLCTCATKDVYHLRHFWVLHRFVKGKNDMVMGMPNLPLFFKTPGNKMNGAILLDLLNSGAAFDFDVGLRNKDLIHIALKFDHEDDHHDYGFKYNSGKWKKTEYDSLMWMWHHEKDIFGKIKNAIVK